jgi:hypothetical protein
VPVYLAVLPVSEEYVKVPRRVPGAPPEEEYKARVVALTFVVATYGISSADTVAALAAYILYAHVVVPGPQPLQVVELLNTSDSAECADWSGNTDPKNKRTTSKAFFMQSS